MDKDTNDVTERMKKFQQGLLKLGKENDIEIIPTIIRGISGDVATITMIDLRNDDMLKKYGRVKIRNADGEPDSDNNSQPPPMNPLAN